MILSDLLTPSALALIVVFVIGVASHITKRYGHFVRQRRDDRVRGRSVGEFLSMHSASIRARVSSQCVALLAMLAAAMASGELGAEVGAFGLPVMTYIAAWGLGFAADSLPDNAPASGGRR